MTWTTGTEERRSIALRGVLAGYAGLRSALRVASWVRMRAGLPGAREVPMPAAMAGAALVMLDKEFFESLDRLYYQTTAMYERLPYNQSGLRPWESLAIEREFSGRRRILATSVGGGREAIGLERAGFVVDAVECNANLAAAANRNLRALGMNAVVRHVPHDRCPANGATYDGAVVGWGSYSLMQGRGVRVAFLAELAAQLRPGAPILFSVRFRGPLERRFESVFRAGARLAKVTGRSAPELGDDIDPEFLHYFTEAELESELASAGLRLASLASIDNVDERAGVAHVEAGAGDVEAGAGAPTPPPGRRDA